MERLRESGIEQHRARPPLPGAQRVAVREPAARHEALVCREVGSAGLQVGHVDVERVEPGPIEGEARLDVAVDPLLTQDRHLGSGAEVDIRRRHVVGGVEGQRHVQPDVVRRTRRRVLLVRALRVVPQRRDPPGHLVPRLLKLSDLLVQQHFIAPRNGHSRGLEGPADHLDAVAQPVFAQERHDIAQGDRGHFEHNPELLRKHPPHDIRVAKARGQPDLDTDPTGERHLAHGRPQAAVGPVVIGRDQVAGAEVGEGGIQAAEPRCVVEVRDGAAEAAEHLREDRPTEARLPSRQADEHEDRAVATQLGRQRPADVG